MADETRRTECPPAVSIVVPVYNVKRYVAQCLRSLRAQTREDIEIICVDDGSTDGSGTISDDVAADDARFVVIHKTNGGYGSAINEGLKRAQGRYVGIVESDDYVESTMFRVLFGAAERHGYPDVVKGAYWRVINADSEDERIIPANFLHRPRFIGLPFRLEQDGELLYHHPSIWSAIYRRDFLLEHGIRMMETPGAGWADNPFLMETLAQADSIVYVDEPLYYYREFNVGSSSLVKDPSVIWSRWLDMDDVVKRLGVTAPRILEGHYNRGCVYIGMLEEGFDTNDPVIAAAINEMANRIDYDVVLRSRRISQADKDAYQKHVSPIRRAAHRLLRIAKPHGAT